MRNDQRPYRPAERDLIKVLGATADANPPAPMAPRPSAAKGIELLMCGYFVLSS